MLAVQTWRQLRFVPFVLGIVLCLCFCASTIYIVPSFGDRSLHFSPCLRPPSGSGASRSPYCALNGQRFPISPQLNGSYDDVLGVFSQIFVISRATRLDRRAAMEQLRQTLALNWTYVDAVSPDDPFVAGVSERVRRLRQQSHACLFQWPPNLNGMATIPSSTISLTNRTRSSVIFMPCSAPISATSLAIAPTIGFSDYLTSKESLPKRSKLRLHGSSNTALSLVTPLTCAVADHIHGVEFHPSLPAHMMLTPSKLACWHSHMSAIARFVGHTYDSQGAALFLEDDVDMERDIRQSVELVWNLLPPDWDIVFLGHCWSNESHYPPLSKMHQGLSVIASTVTIHPSFAPKCTHAYALSQSGARRLLQHLLHPPFSYSRALDQAFSWLVESNHLKAFSLVPSIVIQRKVDRSDIDGGDNGLGSRWKDRLKHGVLEA